ncbi:DUF5926 family protein [Aquipuribacter sp. MA13-6]|uniref:DUF5926 family protein n=1 Tax=unclassified Aquipuribacter TaxID=2635084 RepID=UPI003EEDC56F
MSRRRDAATPTIDPSTPVDPPSGGLRAPCPCGSGKRYKQCHGRFRTGAEFVARPFEGLPRETDWVAFREIVPAATMRTRTTDGTEVVFATVLPVAWPALRRVDGSVFVGVQAADASSDASRDLAAALDAALAADGPGPVTHLDARTSTVRLQDRLDLTVDPVVEVHEGFDFWLDGVLDTDASDASDAGAADDDPLAALAPQVRASLERANEAVVPTEKLTSAESAYWAQIGESTHLRWIISTPEEAFLDALARLHAQRGEDGSPLSTLGEGTRFAGFFRAYGLVVPVWDLADDSTAEATEEPLAAFVERFEAALAQTDPLDGEARRARAGLLARQVTLR